MVANAAQFRVITGSSPRQLLARLDADQSAAALGPFDEETIVVQSLGMERWVRQQLAMRRGAAASLDLPFPAAFCRRLATLLQQAQHGVALDPRFDEQALTWRITALLDDRSELNDAAFAPLATYLAGADAAKRYALARRIASRFDEYRLYRPELLLAWEAGRDDGPDSPHVAWQAALWRRLTNGETPAHFARWFTDTLAFLERTVAPPASLPPRVAVFGVSTLPPLFVRLLQALARFVPVTCYVLTPSAAGWQSEAPRDALEDAFGGTSRELLAALTQHGAPVEHLDAPAAQTPTLLAQLQQALRDPHASRWAAAVKRAIDPTDRSLLVHDCHSPVRELEVLRDQLLDAFAADPTLRPHDVLVMVPDVERYAPLAAIVFGDPHGRATPGDTERIAIPYRLADRALGRDASAAQALAMLLDLVGSRLTASAVLDLLTLPPVQRAAGIAPSQLDQITAWVQAAAIRWGRDGLDRGSHALPSLEDFTWRQGLDRLLAGYATGRIDALVEGVLPIAGDTIGDVELLGAFVDWVDGLFSRLEALRAPRPLAAWSALLQEILVWLVRPDGPGEQGAYDRVQRELVQLARTAGDQLGEAAGRAVPFEVARRWLGTALSGDQHDTGFLTGGLTLCAMKPMRAIPFRVIAMLGLDDRAFPRRERRAAFDCIELAPRPGDRNPKADDRQLFLDTLLCAESRLILSWVGHSQQNNAEIAPSVVLSELLDHLDTTFTGAREHVLVSHALQPFNPVYFTGADVRRFSFDERWARSLAAAHTRQAPPPFWGGASAPTPSLADAAGQPLVVTLDALMDVWCNPARFHCVQVLQLRVPGAGDAVEDAEPVRVAGLEKYAIQQTMLERAWAHTVHGADTPLLSRADDARLTVAAGQLPPGSLGPLWYDRLRDEFEGFWEPLQPLTVLDPLAVRVDGPAWCLVGQLDGQTPSGQRRLRAARVGVKDRVQGWIAHCAYAAMGGTGPTHLSGLKDDTGFAPISADDAVRILSGLIAAYRHVHLAPLPYFPEAGAVYGAKANMALAIDAFERRSEWRPADVDDPHVALLWKGRAPLTDAAAAFIGWCEALWVPLLEAETAYKQGAKGGTRA
ncbi:MAG: exodeoxyribonuclease V subunit gamma [Gemmatimonadaceae bacterium]|nr:exodeoxyribonuclease V subunit gamma [Gemmatimonadaceae bacterium]